MTRFCALVLLLALSPVARGEVKLASVFGDHMVLQRGKAVPIWGVAAPGEAVTVTINGQSESTKAAADGKWRVDFPELPAGGPFELTAAGTNTLTLKDVLVGEVWIASGQSNMEWGLYACDGGAEAIAKSDDPQLRLAQVKHRVGLMPQDSTDMRWALADPKSTRNFSGVGYFFARELRERLRVPVGVIQSGWGGTPAQAWTPRGALEAEPSLRPLVAHWDKIDADWPAAKAAHGAAIERYKQELERARAASQPAPAPVPPAAGNPGSANRASGLYNGMIHPLAPFAIRGVIWYQGESNAGDPYDYRILLAAMIGGWREAFGQGDFPFLIVQLANFGSRGATPHDAAWAELRAAQWRVAETVPNMACAVTIDVGDAKDIHPRNKLDVGRRLALLARRDVYGEKGLVATGPIYRSMKVEGDKARLEFTSVGGGLEVRGGGPLKGFAVAGEDKKFEWADAAIEGETVIVSSAKVAKPAAVRYAWDNDPECNLVNKEGLPAAPFKTDAWPGATASGK